MTDFVNNEPDDLKDVVIWFIEVIQIAQFKSVENKRKPTQIGNGNIINFRSN